MRVWWWWWWWWYEEKEEDGRVVDVDVNEAIEEGEDCGDG